MGSKVAHLRLQRVNLALARMNGPLRAAYLSIGQHFAQGILRETQARYEIGKLVRNVMDDEKKYGSGAVTLLAAALGVKTGRLYDDAKVARLWSPAEFSALVEKPDLHRMPLSFSHLVVLAEVADERRRDELLVLARSEGLTARDLQELTVKRKKIPSNAREPMAVLRRHARLVESLVGTVISVRKAAAALARTPEQRELVVAAVESYQAAKAEIEAALLALEEALGASDEPTAGRPGALPRRKVSGILWGAQERAAQAPGETATGQKDSAHAGLQGHGSAQ